MAHDACVTNFGNRKMTPLFFLKLMTLIVEEEKPSEWNSLVKSEETDYCSFMLALHLVINTIV